MPADPLKQKIHEAKEMGEFFDEFKKLMLTDQFDRIEAEKRKESKRRSEIVEQMLADVMSRGAVRVFKILSFELSSATTRQKTE